MKKELPNKLHELLQVAIKDLRKAERSKRYKINMDIWHEPNSHCSVCMAGAVMAFELDAKATSLLSPNNFGVDASAKLQAINHLRTGSVSGALVTLNDPAPWRASSQDRRVASYPHRSNAVRQRERFYNDMKQLQKDLKRANL